MIQKIISKKRSSLAGRNRKEEHLVRCSTEEELLRHLSGYSVDEEGEVSPHLVLSLFDPARPNWTLKLQHAAGMIDSITLHTLH